MDGLQILKRQQQELDHTPQQQLQQQQRGGGGGGEDEDVALPLTRYLTYSSQKVNSCM